MATPAPVDAGPVLTRREREVADHIAQGLSNRAIAEALVLSPRTVESHIEHIFTKLGFTSRAQVAVWVAEQRRAADIGSQIGIYPHARRRDRGHDDRVPDLRAERRDPPIGARPAPP